MTDFQTSDNLFWGMCMSANQKVHLCITTTHHAEAPLKPGG